ncbi:hypothetical protein OBBRIDRAFT_796085 [Obba rivulosa]|uniref:Uncharacterized protein n=1 Tax=Obba rivulosa TaxID=1052685 RepID=A0A8E2AQK1_9APHY|nr:hypothetical protein OBBRIDRAFT_796085 [Obba rivulosa]
MITDDNPRPSKRTRLESVSKAPPSEASAAALTPLPPPVLLVSLPGLLAHPPNHRFYVQSLYLSILALRKCLSLPALSPEIECRAWTQLAELGMKAVDGGLSVNAAYPWAKGIEAEVEKAFSKGSIIAQKHPSLRAYKHHIALLQAQFSHWQHKTKFARTQLRKLMASFSSSDPPHVAYSAHLAAISLYTTPHSTTSDKYPSSRIPSPKSSPQDVHAALATVQDLEGLARKLGHDRVAILARVLRVRILIASELWEDLPEALARAEEALGLSYVPASTPKQGKPPANANGGAGSPPDAQVSQTNHPIFEETFEAAMALHLLMLSVVFFTYVGNAMEVTPRLAHLHLLLDSGALDKFPNGIVEISFPDAHPLSIQVTHPRVLFLLAFLISSTAKRDAVGRKPKRKIFAAEGLATWETEATREICLTSCATLGDVEEIELRLAKIKADMLCEIIAVSTMRSEFDVAEHNLNILVAHTRTYSIFPLFQARIALHHAHLAHALGQKERALECYRVAAHCAPEHSFEAVAARAGAVALQIGIGGTTAGHASEDDVDSQEAAEVAKLCRSMGGTLEAVGQIIEACISSEILKAKQHLKCALTLASNAQDNHMRALILALIASHYFHTAGDHAHDMLRTCEQLVAGLGASLKPAAGGGPGGQSLPVVGNAPLGLWIGERFLELFKRAGKDDRARKQAALNGHLRRAVEELGRRARTYPVIHGHGPRAR